MSELRESPQNDTKESHRAIEDTYAFLESEQHQASLVANGGSTVTQNEITYEITPVIVEDEVIRAKFAKRGFSPTQLETGLINLRTDMGLKQIALNDEGGFAAVVIHNDGDASPTELSADEQEALLRGTRLISEPLSILQQFGSFPEFKRAVTQAGHNIEKVDPIIVAPNEYRLYENALSLTTAKIQAADQQPNPERLRVKAEAQVAKRFATQALQR